MTDVIDLINNYVASLAAGSEDCKKTDNSSIDWKIFYVGGKINNCRINVDQSITDGSDHVLTYTRDKIKCIIDFFTSTPITSDQLNSYSTILSNQLKSLMTPYKTNLNSNEIDSYINNIIKLFKGQQNSNLNCKNNSQNSTDSSTISNGNDTSSSLFQNFCNFTNDSSQSNFQYIGITNCVNSTIDNIKQNIVFNFVSSVFNNEILLENISSLQSIINQKNLKQKINTEIKIASFAGIFILCLLLIVLIAVYFKSIS